MGALACGPGGEQAKQALEPAAAGSGATVAALMKERGLSEADVSAALKTYMPTGKKDDYYLFSSGGQSGQVHRDRHPEHAHPQVHRRLHARALAGLGLWR